MHTARTSLRTGLALITNYGSHSQSSTTPLFEAVQAETSFLFGSGVETRSNPKTDQPRPISQTHFSKIPPEVFSIISSFLDHKDISKTLLPVSRKLLDIIVHSPNFKFFVPRADGTTLSLGYEEFISVQLQELKEQIRNESQGLSCPTSPALWALDRGLGLGILLSIGVFAVATLVVALIAHIPPLVHDIEKKNQRSMLTKTPSINDNSTQYDQTAQSIEAAGIAIAGSLAALACISTVLCHGYIGKYPSSCAGQFSEEFMKNIRIRRAHLNSTKKVQTQERIHREFLEMCRRIEAEINS